jgi:zinc D-Ala-D-Ala dipeptidase
MTILLSDPRVSAIPVEESGEPMVVLPEALAPTQCLVRTGVAARLLLADAMLPEGIALRVVEGHRSVVDQQRIIAHYSAQICATRPGIGPDELRHLVSRFVSPVQVAPHVSGSAVDLTLVDGDGRPLDLGTEIDATPEASGGRCFTDSPDISPAARRHRDLLSEVLTGVGLVNYPTEWWHWSWGDRYWALVSGAPAALHSPVQLPTAVVAA